MTDETIFVQKTHFTPKCKIFIMMCSVIAFTIIVWDFIKIARKLQKLQITNNIP